MTFTSAPNDQVAVRATKWLYGVMLALAGLMLAARWLTWTVELVPDRSEAILKIAGIVGLLSGVAAVATILWFKLELRWRPVPSAIVLGPTFALLTLLSVMGIADAAFQRVDFLHAPLRRTEAHLAINRGYTTSGKGWHYHVQLAEVFATLDVTKRDYENAFGKAEDTRDEGWCLLSTMERSGAAVRIVLGRRWPFAAGRIVRCPLGAGMNVILRRG